MKTVCLYFQQVHQPWRLKKYRFFNMGKDHNYLDDLLNRSIMQKVARQCYLPMNALLLKLIRENKGKFRCSFSIHGHRYRTVPCLCTRSPQSRSRNWPPRAAWIPCRNLPPLVGIAGVEGGFHRTGKAPRRS